MGSRKVVTRSKKGYQGYFPSIKLNNLIEFESILEMDAALLFEYSMGVVRYRAQPEVITYEIDGELHKYHPDFELELKNGDLVHIEVKPVEELKKLNMKKKIKCIEKRYETHDATFKVLSEEEIRKQPLHQNLKHLFWPKLPKGNLDEVLKGIKSHIEERGKAAAIDFFMLYDPNDILLLISRGDILCDLNKVIFDPENYLQINEGAENDSVLF